MMLEGSAASATLSFLAAVAAEISFEFLHVECVFLGNPILSTSLGRSDCLLTGSMPCSDWPMNPLERK
jgi:hypothetical protein